MREYPHIRVGLVSITGLARRITVRQCSTDHTRKLHLAKRAFHRGRPKRARSEGFAALL